MMLKDCPVGSKVRLASLSGYPVKFANWQGVFEVFQGENGKYVIDGDGMARSDINSAFAQQFEIVSTDPTPLKTVYLKGKTYNLIPVRTSDVIEIDGVEYYMEEK